MSVDQGRGSIARNRSRQCELYGAPLGDRVRRLTAALGITQARLAHALGLSPAMLSQLVSGRRVKIGDPAVLARLMLLDQRCTVGAPLPRAAAEALLTEVAHARLQWTSTQATVAPVVEERPRALRARPAPPQTHPAAAALRSVAPPARLAAAAATLAPAFPELAELLRQAAGRPRAR